MQSGVTAVTGQTQGPQGTSSYEGESSLRNLSTFSANNREARVTKVMCARHRGSTGARGERCRAVRPGCTPQEKLSRVGQSPLPSDRLFSRNTPETGRVGLGSGEKGG